LLGAAKVIDALQTFRLELLCCEGLGPSPNAWDAIEAVQSLQGRFFDFEGGPAVPETRIDYSGQILGLLSYEHELLAQDYWKRLAVWEGKARASEPRAAAFSFLQ